MTNGPSHQREQRERRETLRNDQLVRNAKLHEKLAPLFERNDQLQRDRDPASTLLAFAESEAGSISGRWRSNQKSRVLGAKEEALYPNLPPSSPWSSPDPSGLEPPFGIDINAVEPVGEYGEIEASIAPSATGQPRTDLADGQSPDESCELGEAPGVNSQPTSVPLADVQPSASTASGPKHDVLGEASPSFSPSSEGVGGQGLSALGSSAPPGKPKPKPKPWMR
jgi:hypothetical protein